MRRECDVRFTSSVRAQLLSYSPSSMNAELINEMPALLTSTSMPPNVSATPATIHFNAS